MSQARGRLGYPGEGCIDGRQANCSLSLKPKIKRVSYLTLVGTDTAKELVYQRYRITEPGAGYCHWPVKDEFDEDYFKAGHR